MCEAQAIPSMLYGVVLSLLLICFYRLSHVGTGRVNGTSVEVIGGLDQLGLFNWSVSGIGRSLYPFK